MLLSTRSMFPVAALGVILAAFPCGIMKCQPSLDEPGQRRAAEAFFTALRTSAGGNRVDAAGIGVRLLWDAGRLVEVAPAVARRAEVGVYGEYIPRQNLSGADAFTAYRLGVAGDLRLLEMPLAGMFDPVLSIGAGMWHSNATGTITARSPLLGASVTAMEVAPGVGVRVPFGPATGIRFDVHDAMTLRSGARTSLGFGAGLRFHFL